MLLMTELTNNLYTDVDNVVDNLAIVKEMLLVYKNSVKTFEDINYLCNEMLIV